MFPELPTPCGLVDVFEANAARMRERARRLGVRLRAHVKTHKTVEGARVQHGGEVGPMTVSTLAEARMLASAGFRDLTYAVPIGPGKLAAAADLAGGLDRLGLLVDSEQAAIEVERCAATRGRRLSVFLKVDCGYHRAGVDPGRPESAALATRLARSPHLEFRGLLTHAGHSYRCRSPEEIRPVADRERDVPVEFALRLRDAGIEVPEVSIGSTPTLSVAQDLGGVTEVRPGNYVFHDVFQATIGSCGLEDVAFTVLAEVIGVHPEEEKVLLDAGALALSKDEGARHVDPDAGFGRILGAPDSRVVSLSQEHGIVRTGAPRWRVGDRVRILPNHSCLAAACFDRFHVHRGNRIVAEWATTRGW